MPTDAELNAKFVELDEKARSVLREQGWTDDRIEAEFRKPKKGKRRA